MKYFRSWKNWKGRKIDKDHIKDFYHRTAKTSTHDFDPKY